MNDKMSNHKFGVIISYFTMFSAFFISILYTPFLVRILGQSEFGLYNLALSIVSYLSILSFGLGSAYIKFFNKYRNQNENEKISILNGMFLSIFVLISIISLIIGSLLIAFSGYIFADKISPDELVKLKIMLAILVFNLSLTFPNIIFNSYILVHERFIFQKSMILLKSILTPLFSIPLLLLGYGSIGVVFSVFIATLLIEVTNIIYSKRKLRIMFTFKNFDSLLLKQVLIFSSFIFISLLIDQVNWSLDKILLGVMKGTKDVAVYSIGSQINSYYLMISTAISSVFVPRIFKMVESEANNQNILDFVSKIAKIQFILLFFALGALLIFGKLFLQLWVGTEYMSSYYIILLLIIPGTIPLIQTLFLEVERAKNIHKYRVAIYLISALVNILITIPMIQIYSATGAAIGTAISVVLSNIALNYFYYYKLKLNVGFFWKKITVDALVLLIPITITYLIKHLFVNDFVLHNTLLFAFYVFSYMFVLWFICLSKSEKTSLIKSFLHKT